MAGKVAVVAIVLLIVLGVFGYTIYQKYSPLSELAKCENCVDYKKIEITHQETPVPDIRIVAADTEKMVMDVPIIIRNPSTKDTETVKIDFDVYMEGRHLTKGTLPAHELPAKRNTTFWIKNVVISYEDLGEVLQVVAARHGAEMVREGKASVAMTVYLLIYFPIKISTINIYTVTIPIQLETEVPVDMLKQKEETEKQIEETIEETIGMVQEEIVGTIPTLPPETSPPAATPQKTVLPLPTPTLPPAPALP